VVDIDLILFSQRRLTQSLLTNSNRITNLHAECGRHMRSQVLMSLLVTVCGPYVRSLDQLTNPRRTVLGDVVQVIPADNERSRHFCRDNFAGQDSPTNRDVAGKGAFLVCARPV
jgi:hypothetical protein